MCTYKVFPLWADGKMHPPTYEATRGGLNDSICTSWDYAVLQSNLIQSSAGETTEVRSKRCHFS